MNVFVVLALGSLLFACQNEMKTKTLTSETAAVTYKPGLAVNLVGAGEDTPPLFLGSPSAICSGMSFYNAAGELATGNADCGEGEADSNLKPEHIKQGITIAGVTGTAAVVEDIPEISPENIRAGVSIAGISGSLVPSPVACSVDGQINCVSSASFPAAAATGLAAKIAAGQTVGGVSGTFAGSYSNCSSDGEAGCIVVGPAYAAAVTAGAASKILSGQSVAGISGNVILPAPGKVLTGTSYGISGNGSSGTLTLPAATHVLTGSGTFGDPGAAVTPSYSPDFPSLANVRAGDTVNGASGTLGDCSAAGQSGCVATSSYKTMDLSAAGTDTGLTATNFNATIAASGTFEFWDASGARHSVAGDADLVAANVLSGKTIFGVAGSVTASPANCSSNGSQSCVATGSYFAATSCAADESNCYLPPYVVTTQPLKAISYDAIYAAKGSIRTSLSLSGVAGTLTDCSSNAETGCVTTSSYQSADLTNLAAGNIKRGITIAGTTGNFPSAASPLPNYSDSGATTNTSGSDITDLTNFITQLTTDGAFEYWDSTGIRRTGSGDSDIVAAKIKNAVALENLSLTGTYGADCTADGQTACLTTSTYKSIDTSSLSTWDIRKGKSAGGIAGSLTFFKNMANGQYNRTTGTAASAGLDIYDTVDDINNLSSFPTQNNTGWDQATGANWTQVVANTTYKDEITGLVWLVNQGGMFWDTAIGQCENATGGGRSDWRLPTEKELLQAYTDGLWSQKTNLGLTNTYYWSATTVSFTQANAWAVSAGTGNTISAAKTTATYSVICVAP